MPKWLHYFIVSSKIVCLLYSFYLTLRRFCLFSQWQSKTLEDRIIHFTLRWVTLGFEKTGLLLLWLHARPEAHQIIFIFDETSFGETSLALLCFHDLNVIALVARTWKGLLLSGYVITCHALKTLLSLLYERVLNFILFVNWIHLLIHKHFLVQWLPVICQRSLLVLVLLEVLIHDVHVHETERPVGTKSLFSSFLQPVELAEITLISQVKGKCHCRVTFAQM